MKSLKLTLFGFVRAQLFLVHEIAAIERIKIGALLRKNRLCYYLKSRDNRFLLTRIDGRVHIVSNHFSFKKDKVIKKILVKNVKILFVNLPYFVQSSLTQSVSRRVECALVKLESKRHNKSERTEIVRYMMIPVDFIDQNFKKIIKINYFKQRKKIV